jgi:hypothetical protein
MTMSFLQGACLLVQTNTNGLLLKEAVDKVQELAPDITRVAAHRQIIRYVLPVNSTASVLKKSAQKVQATEQNNLEN